MIEANSIIDELRTAHSASSKPHTADINAYDVSQVGAALFFEGNVHGNAPDLVAGRKEAEVLTVVHSEYKYSSAATNTAHGCWSCSRSIRSDEWRHISIYRHIDISTYSNIGIVSATSTEACGLTAYYKLSGHSSPMC